MVGAWKKFFKGEGHNSEFEAGFREMFKDIARYLENKKIAIFSMWMFKRERAGLGGDRAIAGVLLTSSLRKIARLK